MEANHNLCATCSHINKCKRIKKINAKLTKIMEVNFEKYDIDLDIDFTINDCPKCDVDLDALDDMDYFGYENDEDDEDDDDE